MLVCLRWCLSVWLFSHGLEWNRPWVMHHFKLLNSQNRTHYPITYHLLPGCFFLAKNVKTSKLKHLQDGAIGSQFRAQGAGGNLEIEYNPWPLYTGVEDWTSAGGHFPYHFLERVVSWICEFCFSKLKNQLVGVSIAHSPSCSCQPNDNSPFLATWQTTADVRSIGPRAAFWTWNGFLPRIYPSFVTAPSFTVLGLSLLGFQSSKKNTKSSQRGYLVVLHKMMRSSFNVILHSNHLWWDFQMQVGSYPPTFHLPKAPPGVGVDPLDAS